MHEKMYNQPFSRSAVQPFSRSAVQPFSRSDSSCPLISVIVPLYKVEKYLDRCITSIANQTYSNLEIILVDDGSPDKCPAMCDEWSKKDERIRVIHKENGGQSSARNAGLDIAKGELIGFIDSDDFILPEMYEYLYRLMIENDADLSISGYLFVDENGSALKNGNEAEDIETIEIFSCEDVLRNFVTGKKGFEIDRYRVVWNKLYSARIFQDLRFVDGNNYEDEIVAHHILGESRRTVITHRKLYMYTQREGSIMGEMRKGHFTARDIADELLIFVDRYEYLENLGFKYLAGEVLIQGCEYARCMLMRESYIKYFRAFNSTLIPIVKGCLRLPGIKMKLRAVGLFRVILRNITRDIYRTAKKFIIAS